MRRWPLPALLAIVAAMPVGLPAAHAEDDVVAPSLSVVIPSGSYVVDASGPVITGTVTGSAGRRVEVQARGSNGTWVPLARTRSRADHSFAVATPTWWLGDHVLRVYAPSTSADAAVESTTTGEVTVTPAEEPRGGTAARYLGSSYARWNPCRPISYRINPDLMWRGGRSDVRTALTEVSRATGLRFRYAGESAYVPYARHRGRFPGNADVVVAWSTPRRVPALRGDTAGFGGSSYRWSDTPENAVRYDGTLVLDARQRLGSNRAERDRLRAALLLHEIGHVIGLDHVSDRRQLMYPRLRSGVAPHYAAGDLRGLAHLGAAGGCVEVPLP